MEDTPSIFAASVSSSSYVVTDTATYTFSINPSTPLITGDVITLIFPDEFNNPVANTLTQCLGVVGLVSSLSCKAIGPNSIHISAVFLESPFAENFKFSIVSVQNPPSTASTGLF